MAKVSDLQLLRTQTWEALEVFELDHNDSKSVLRYEKLVKLFLALEKALSAKIKPEQTPNKLDQFLMNENEDPSFCKGSFDD
jgi:hypothetical protein